MAVGAAQRFNAGESSRLFALNRAAVAGAVAEVRACDRQLGGIVAGLLDADAGGRPEAAEVRRALAQDGCADDRRALVDLFRSTGGRANPSHWKRTYNWLDKDTEVGAWFGVEAVDGRVVGIDLANNGLRGELPASIGMLQQLKRLVLWGNLLRGPLPPSLVNCSQ